MRQGHRYVLIIFLLVSLYLLCNHKNGITNDIGLIFSSKYFHATSKNSFLGHIEENYKTVIQPNGPPLKFIILAMTDESFVDIALNLYFSSFKRFNIPNYLFVGTGSKACMYMNSVNINCVYYTDDPESGTANTFNSKSFIRKMNIRTSMILDALRAGYTVLHTDLDVVFLNDPLPYIEDSLQTANMAILWDSTIYNAGFLAIKPTNFSIKVYEESQARTNKSDTLDDQTALNQAIAEIKNKRKDLNGNVTALDKNLFLCGRCYFQFKDRDFPWKNGSDSCPGCLVVHNNWIVSLAAKVYRFKENNMWWVDNDGYFSNETRKYLLLDNPVVINSTSKVLELEKEALKSGLIMAYILQRTLILPRFHCHGGEPNKECPLNSLLKISAFDSEFANLYRASSFLYSPLVPSNIHINKLGICSIQEDKTSDKRTNICSVRKKKLECSDNRPVPFVIRTKKSIPVNFSSQFDEFIQLDFPDRSDLDEGMVLKNFGHCDDSVLYIASLLGVEIVLNDANSSAHFGQKIKKGFVESDYAQFKN